MPGQAEADVEPREILFICTGNYYRSRFAEAFFNYLAAQDGLPWRAISRGLARYDQGPISAHTVRRLQTHGIDLGDEPRSPIRVTDDDFARADVVVALKEVEHRPMIEEQFPKRGDFVEYWHIHDVDVSAAEESLAELERNVRDLVERLKDARGGLARHAAPLRSEPKGQRPRR